MYILHKEKKKASDGLRGHMFEPSPADLQDGESASRNSRLKMVVCVVWQDFTHARICPLTEKCQTIVEVHTDVKTTEGCFLC